MDTQVTIPNASPSIVSIFTSDAAFGSEGYSDGIIDTLVPDGLRTLYVTGVVEDGNDRLSVSRVWAVFYRSGVDGGVDCAANDANDCYVSDNCALSIDEGVSDYQQRYSCPISLQYFVDGTMFGGEFPDEHWVVEVYATDTVGDTSDPGSLEREIQTLLSVSFPSVIAYGTLSPGESTDEYSRVIQLVGQSGNDEADVEVYYQTFVPPPFYGGTMDCVHNGGTGSIPNSLQQWSLRAGGYDASGTKDLSSEPTVAALNVGYRHGVNPVRPLYWNISIPSAGVLGTCTGSVTISAVSH